MSLHQRVEEIYENTRGDVYYYLLTLGLDPGEAQDLTQEAILRLYVTLRNGEDIRNPRAWIFRVAHNLGLKARMRNSRIAPINDESDVLLRSGEDSPETRAIDLQRTQLLDRAILELSPQQRQVLHLRAEGLRYHEIASAIGISVSSVSEFLRRALTKLRRVAYE